MKKTILLLANLFFVFLVNAQTAQTSETKSIVKIKGEVKNKKSDILMVKVSNNSGLTDVKQFKLNEKGLFEDTLEAQEGIYMIADGTSNEAVKVYLQPDFDLNIVFDANKVEESVVFSGKGAGENNFFSNFLNENKKMGMQAQTLIELPDAEFKKYLADLKTKNVDEMNKKQLKPEFIKFQTEIIDAISQQFMQYYQMQNKSKAMNNTVAPDFEYTNYKGGTTKLSSFKGKYVYIDVWATWCGPCRAEIPSLKKVEEEFHNKNIVFLSLSIDKITDTEKWKNFVKEKSLGGVQLLADKDWSSSFVQALDINSIPRFILVGPDGKIVNADAPRPSSPALTDKLKELLK